MPTVLDLAGLKSPSVTGLSRAQSLKTGAVIPDNQSYAESLYGSIHFGYAPVRALRAEGFKYIDTPKAELYRVASDPVEATNLLAARAPLAAAMQKQLRQMHGEDATQAVALAPVDAATQERLAALGYVAGGSGAAPQGASQLPDPKDRAAQYDRYSRSVNEALLARRRREPEGVVKALLPIASEFSSKLTISSFLGEALLEMGRFTEAIPHLIRARDASPLAWARWGRLAEAYAGAGRLSEALDATEKGLAAAPKATELIRLRTVLLTRPGRGAEALRFIEAQSAANPQDGLLLAEVASLRRNSGDIRAADVMSARAITLSPDQADAWLSRGLVLAASGRSEEAGLAFEKATKLDPRSADAWFYAATIEIQKGNSARATELLGKVRVLEPRRPGLAEAIAAARAVRPAGSPPSVGPRPSAQGTMRLLMIRCRTREEGTSILARIAKGEDFAAIVRSLAGPDGGGPKGFDLGPVRPEDLKPPLNAAAAKLQPGRSSPLIELADGFVILKRNP
jgi:tetratricopeptide (TPR) repeat protein